jgi:hypothetical protein
MLMPSPEPYSTTLVATNLLMLCVMVICSQRKTEGEKDYVRHWSDHKEK